MKYTEKFLSDAMSSGDLKKMVECMDHNESYPNGLFGNNSNGEDIFVSVCNEKIILQTFQDNGVVKVNTYHKDGTTEETYER